MFRGQACLEWGTCRQGKTVPRILVADDNTNIQKMVVLAFQERGVEVIAVGNGEAAVRRLPDANPDLVLADVFMPVRNGYEVCEFVKKDPRFSHVPVILLVGAFDPLDEKEARRVGADGVLKKPFVPPDPLIAMVMSALEKNPKVAAELARAKEVAAEAALPPALPEVPLKAEPKPLPEFPEPTAEEAAVIYGFGKGVRAIDLGDVEEEEDEEETPKAAKKAKATSKESKAPKAPAAPKTPVVAAEDDDDEFDGSATANDWRRNAADFEVPENVAADPVYSYGQDFKPITFPSEKDVPPRHVRPEEAAAQATEAKAETPAVEQKSPAETTPAIVDAPAEVATKSNEWDVKNQPEIELAAGSFSRLDEPDVQAKYSEAELAKAKHEAVAEAPAVQHEAVAEEAPSRPSLVSRMRGWMDMLTPAPAENPVASSSDTSENHWMTNLSAPVAAPESAIDTAPIVAPVVAAPVVEDSVSAPAEEPVAAPTVVEAHAVESASAATEQAAEPVHAEEFAPASEFEKQEEEPRPHFDPSKFSDAKYGGSSYHFSDDAQAEVREQVVETQEEGPSDYSASETVSESLSGEAEPEPITSSAADFSPVELPALGDAPTNGSGLSGQMPAEPLFGSAPQHDETDYSLRDEVRDEEPPQTDAREQEAFAEETHPGQQSEPAPSEDHWNREAAAHEETIAAQASGSLFDESVAEPPAVHGFERIPTLPPPNREALSEIPFLMPPVLPPQNADQSVPGAANSETVDEVVRQVMAKLGPHLQELLSQGVKPLVENLLQNELHKKEK